MAITIPAAGGVPGISGPPDWLSAPPTGNFALDDVRWIGAMRTAFGAGGAGGNSLRAVNGIEGGKPFLYLSFRAAFVQSLSDQGDLVYLGLRKTADPNAMVVRLQVHPPSFLPAGPPSANPPAHVASVQIATRATGDTSWTVQATPPAWIDANARAWVQSAADDPLNDPNNRWAIELRIPIIAGSISAAAGPDLGTDFEMWYVMLGTLSNGSPTILADYRKTGATTIGDLTLGKYPNPLPAPLWDEFLVASGPAAFGGVAIYGNGYTDVVVRNASHGVGTTIENGQPNTFIARPRNYRVFPNSIAAGNINATFRIANWGSVAGDPHQINFATGVWDYVPGNSATTPVISSLAIPELAAAGNPPANEPIALTTTMNLAANKSLHQCVFVTLSGTSPGTGMTFLNDSTYQNMDFDHASLLERDAEISIVGLTPFGAPPRDVYLAVEKLNMESTLPAGTTEEALLQSRLERLVRKGGTVGENVTQGMIGDARISQTKRNLDSVVDALSQAGFGASEFDQLFPTFRVHAYHDTGERVVGPDGLRHPVVRAQSSFGVYAYHEGGLDGWQTSIQGATRIDDNLYLLAVPNNGTAKVKVRIQAVAPGETRIPEDPIVKLPNDSNPGCLGLPFAWLKKLFGHR